MGTNVGILGLGVYLPPEVRRNDWWSPELVARWMEDRRLAGTPPLPAQLTEGERLVLRAMSEQALDPFQGTIERHIMPSGMTVFDMEEQAARTAIARAGIDGSDIDLLITNTVLPDYLLGNPACGLHQRLGLANACFSMHCDVPTYAFMMQLTLAEAMIKAGRARRALLVQSTSASRLLDMTDPIAPFFGDAATAVVVGSVSDGRGIEASVHFTDGRYPRTLIAGVPGHRWCDEGRAMIHIGDAAQTQSVFLQTADRARRARTPRSRVRAVPARTSTSSASTRGHPGCGASCRSTWVSRPRDRWRRSRGPRIFSHARCPPGWRWPKIKDCSAMTISSCSSEEAPE